MFIIFILIVMKMLAIPQPSLADKTEIAWDAIQTQLATSVSYELPAHASFALLSLAGISGICGGSLQILQRA